LDITVTPKQGRALFWANTLVFDPQRIDPRLVHESKPVIRGDKVAVNSWGHMYNYVIPNHWGCTGSFETL
jgi:prolyl 4-hydroxylase